MVIPGDQQKKVVLPICQVLCSQLSNVSFLLILTNFEMLLPVSPCTQLKNGITKRGWFTSHTFTSLTQLGVDSQDVHRPDSTIYVLFPTFSAVCRAVKSEVGFLVKVRVCARARARTEGSQEDVAELNAHRA